MQTLGESLIGWLEVYGVDTVFGIPGVHNVELYRGLSGSGIRHVTPRHEQGAGFMADGYARVTRKPGVAFVITGPGLTNILTPMAQAYADSIPMLVISSTNRTALTGMGGDLHEIRNPGLIAAQAAAFSHTITDPAQLPQIMARAWAVFDCARPRPVHIQIPLDLLSQPVDLAPPKNKPFASLQPSTDSIRATTVMRILEKAEKPLILCGGGAVRAFQQVKAMALHLDAPVVSTTNGRGVCAGDPFDVPASPSLHSVRALITDADVVLAVGTELGRTDYDMYDRGGPEITGRLIHIDLDPEQAALGLRSGRGVALNGDAAEVLESLLKSTSSRPPSGGGHSRGAARAERVRRQAWDEIGPAYRRVVGFLNMVRDSGYWPIICDSTQAAYAGNLYFAPDGLRDWFNAATGYGALGYGLPAAIGAAKGLDRPVVCIAGDGGLQFTLTDLGTAVEERLPVILLVWNNRGYGEIKQFMLDRQITPVGVDLHTPDFVAIGRAYGAEALRLERLADLPDLLRAAAGRSGPTLIEIDEELVLGQEMG